MDGLKRCPQCHQLPEVKIEPHRNGVDIIFSCEIHGHMATGPNEEIAVMNWNHYVSFGKVA